MPGDGDASTLSSPPATEDTISTGEGEQRGQDSDPIIVGEEDQQEDTDEDEEED
jgi:hypothetical protein